MNAKAKRRINRAKYAALGAAGGAAIGGVTSRNAARTGASIGAFVGATVGESRAPVKFDKWRSNRDKDTTVSSN
ncbi:YMGG-like glycine zipper-containing protein [Halalkalicoccus subterraneus]|uniref:YMGG-like glycine zipper-containing protein n=1 Tax=Halalkalicoccus subterraneus TaxID=2675002 RepID=UPI000EFD3FE9|nr:YMGG-like glycine zipper-containing protein [Halalkalicoccus subterraneus]